MGSKSLRTLALALSPLLLVSHGCAPTKTTATAKVPPPPKPGKPAEKVKTASVQVEPAKFVLTGKWASQTLVVMGRSPGGALHDVTRQAQFKSVNSRIAAVTKTGIVTPASDGLTTISISVPGIKGSTVVPVTVKDSQNASASFLNQVRPVIGKLGCNSTQCHGAQKGKGGFKLSLFGGDSESDFDALTKSAAGRRINRVEPMKSLVLLKASGSVPHAGGQKLRTGSPEYEMVVSWLMRGGPWSLEKEPQIVGIRIFPEQRILQKGETQQFLATAVYSDGSQRDVTRDAVFNSSQVKIAAVAGSGKIEAKDFGESAVTVNYLRQAGVARVIVPQPLPDPFPKLLASNPIDELVYTKLKLLGIPPSGPVSDAEFLRRIYLDVIGLLPSSQEARKFLAGKDPNKRAKLIDQLLDRDEFADFWALKWGDLLRIKSEYPVRIWPKAVAVYYRWVRESVARNKPYDQFVRELLTTNGSNFRVGPSNFVRAVQNKDPQTIGETTALVFMGTRVGCARCHGHPSENWSLQDDLGMGAFFAKVNYKSSLEWKEEIVYSDPKKTLRNPKSRDVVKPMFLGGKVLELDREEDPRQKLADWLISPQNPWFSKCIVNRVWYWLLDRGIVHEPDDLRPTNPPENPELLDYLARELVSHNYDLKHIYRLILNSQTYQRSSAPNQWNASDTAHFSHYIVKRLTAEQLLDAISQVTETSEKFRSIIPEPFSNWPAGYRATQISDGNTECTFLDMFGRPPRDTPYEEERSSDVSLKQSLYFINSEQLAGKISGSPRIQRLLKANQSDADTIEDLYLSTLSRFPTNEDKQRLLEYLAKNKSVHAQAVQDVVWAVMNAKEFVFNH